MKNIPLEVFVNKHYNKIKLIVRKYAHDFFIDKGDLLSEVNLKLSNCIASNVFTGEHDTQFFGFLHSLIRNVAVDSKRKNYVVLFLKQDGRNRNTIKHKIDKIEIGDVNELDFKNYQLQPDFELKAFLKQICAELSQSKRKDFKEIFDSYFIAGMKYEEISNAMDMPMNNVKTKIFQIRKFINSEYGETFKQLTA